MHTEYLLQKEKREGKRRDIQAQLTRLQQQLSDEKSRRRAEQLDKSWKVRQCSSVLAAGSYVVQVCTKLLTNCWQLHGQARVLHCKGYCHHMRICEGTVTNNVHIACIAVSRKSCSRCWQEAFLPGQIREAEERIGSEVRGPQIQRKA